MYITEITLTDLKCFRGTHHLDLMHGDRNYAGWTVFAGRNGAGKSTLLKALVLATADLARAASLDPGYGRRWTRFGAAKSMCQIGLQSPARWTGQLPLVAGQGANFLGMRILNNPPAHAAAPTLPIEEEERLREAFSLGWPPPHGWFIAAYGPSRHLGARDAEQERFEGDPALRRLASLFVESASLAEGVEWLQKVHTRALERKEGAKQLKKDVLRLLHDDLLPDGWGVLGVDSDGLWLQRDNTTMLLNAMSDGHRIVTALVLDMVRHLHDCYGDLRLEEGPSWRCPLPGVVLIDEVDAHMHVGWQQRIGFWLTEHFPRIQFLVTTHSPFICQAASPGGLIRLPAPGEDRTIERVPEHLADAIRNGGADLAVMTELFGLEHAHSARAETLRQRVATLELRVLDEEATEAELAEYDRLRNQLPDNMRELADRSVRALLARQDRA